MTTRVVFIPQRCPAARCQGCRGWLTVRKGKRQAILVQFYGLDGRWLDRNQFFHVECYDGRYGPVQRRSA